MLFTQRTCVLVIKYKLIADLTRLIPRPEHDPWCLENARQAVLQGLRMGRVYRDRDYAWGLAQFIRWSLAIEQSRRQYELTMLFPEVNGVPVLSIDGRRRLAFAHALEEEFSLTSKEDVA